MPLKPNGAFARIIRAVSMNFWIAEDKIMGVSRAAPIVHARHVAIYIARRHLVKDRRPISLNSLGRLLERDHTTIAHAIKCIERLRKKDTGLNAQLEKLEIEFPPQLLE